MIFVTIHDHLTKQDHVSEWRPDLVGQPLILRAIQAAWVRAFGSSCGPVEFMDGHWYARGMFVDVKVEKPVAVVVPQHSLVGVRRPSCPSCAKPLPRVAYKHLHRHVLDGSMIPVYNQAVIRATRLDDCGRERPYTRVVRRVEFRLAEVAA